ncbi:cytochrome c oxidase subunit 3 [Novipirellula artificiosorum]|uniref:Cytochrome o ubiquinol oxidase subunit III n=1 Tax=Novipirellula artificiosorum TaxID=2528016 RepID=A0A5C6D4F9_9BACT|nr:cytochrome c oxidase subunit 3 [Novipirellula artificiosorum]TWU31782.1 cytochrome o ubiquinol oxidase subunit III [Novipirellula artificiosorum]
MPFSSTSPLPSALPRDRRYEQGGWLLLASLSMFFISSVLLYGLYAYGRRDDPLSLVPLPKAFLLSTVLLVVTSGLLHVASLTIRREKRWRTAGLIAISAGVAIGFLLVQFHAMNETLNGPALRAGNGKGLAGMVAVLVFLHALHVAGGILALGIVFLRTVLGKYDHERYWPVRFAAHYWHFLDLVWLCMLASFWLTAGSWG